jgi:hypothetical protein
MVVNIIGDSLPGIGVPRYAVHGVERIRLRGGEIPVTQWSASSSMAPSYSPATPEHQTGPRMPTAARAIPVTTRFAVPSLSLHSSSLHRSPWLPYDLENEGGRKEWSVGSYVCDRAPDSSRGAPSPAGDFRHGRQVCWSRDDNLGPPFRDSRRGAGKMSEGPACQWQEQARARVRRAGPACRRPYQIRLRDDLAKWASSRELGPTRPSLFLFPFYFSILFSFSF